MILEKHAKEGVTVDGKFYKTGEFLPFYVPRTEMPQVDEKDIPELLVWAHYHQISIKIGMEPPSTFHAHQRVDITKVKGMPPELMNKPCLVSSDHYILDGNHRWWGHVLTKTPVPYFRFGLSFERAIPWLFTFPKTYSYGDGKIHPIQN